ncbi:MAG: hypothetical protein PHT43_05105 [Anaerolineaceae bacterium]|nr:hypothetical protein [Anaerolineaceae bacterium]
MNYEPLPASGLRPALPWRMSHELGAANHGYVWPRVSFVPDGESMSIWAEPFSTPGQSVNYTTGSEAAKVMPLLEFQTEVDCFVEAVISRLLALGKSQADLLSLWSLIKEDRENNKSARRRQLEAQMGFDLDDCPEAIMREALRLQMTTGAAAMSEMAPIFGNNISDIARLQEQPGIQGKPQVRPADFEMPKLLRQALPWEQGMNLAKQLRKKYDIRTDCVADQALLDILGITLNQFENWLPVENLPVGLGRPDSPDTLTLLCRKRHPRARRFELARFLGDVISPSASEEGWLVSSDLVTARQKRQRSFAAEFLCPIDALVAFLNGKYSESAQEEAAENFQVSEKTVETLLINHGYVDCAQKAF